MMSERDKLLITLQNRIDEARNKHLKTTTIFTSTLSKCMKFVKEHPDIVRCENCRYNDYGECIIRSGWFPVKPDWYCSDGVEK